MVPTNYSQSTDGQRFCTVPLCEDKRAAAGVVPASIVGIVQLGDACSTRAGTVRVVRVFKQASQLAAA